MLEEDLHELQVFQSLLPAVRRYVGEHLPESWPELGGLLSPLVDQPLDPRPVLPLASCAAVGGDPADAIPAAAAWEALSVAAGILDDLQDQDRTDGLWARIGPPRAFNVSAALYALSIQWLVGAPWPSPQREPIVEVWLAETIGLAAGQDRDLRGDARTIETYWQTIEGKTARAFALACEVGARCGTESASLIEAVRTYGYHLGLALQLFDDFEGLWEPTGMADVDLGRLTLPVLYGLSISHAGQEELQRMVQDGSILGDADRVRIILDEIHTRDFMIWASLQERDLALDALAGCPGHAGVMALHAYITAIFAHADELASVATAGQGGE